MPGSYFKSIAVSRFKSIAVSRTLYAINTLSWCQSRCLTVFKIKYNLIKQIYIFSIGKIYRSNLFIKIDNIVFNYHLLVFCVLASLERRGGSLGLCRIMDTYEIGAHNDYLSYCKSTIAEETWDKEGAIKFRHSGMLWLNIVAWWGIGRMTYKCLKSRGIRSMCSVRTEVIVETVE